MKTKSKDPEKAARLDELKTLRRNRKKIASDLQSACKETETELLRLKRAANAAARRSNEEMRRIDRRILILEGRQS